MPSVGFIKTNDPVIDTNLQWLASRLGEVIGSDMGLDDTKLVTIDTAQTITGLKRFEITGDMIFEAQPETETTPQGLLLMKCHTKFYYPPWIYMPDNSEGRHILFSSGSLPSYNQWDIGTSTAALWYSNSDNKFRYSYGVTNPLDTQILATGSDITTASMKVSVSSNDTTTGYLNGKLVAGTGITLTENNDGGNETLTIANPNDHASGSDNQNLWATVSSDSGSSTADSETDTITIAGSGGINTSVSGDTLTVGIADGAITEAKLDISNAPSDGQYLTYDTGAGKPTWHTLDPWTVNNEFQESPNGVLTTFTVTGGSYTSGGIIVTLNGQILNTTQWSEVTPASGTIEFVTAPLSTDELRWHGAGAGSLGGSSTDELAKVSANDTTAGYLNGKLVAGSNITLTEGNDGANEILTIASTASGGAWETLYDYTVSGSAISRYLMTVSEATHSSFMLKILFYNGTGTACQNYLYYNNDETDTNYYRQKYYYTGGSLSASQDNNPFIGGVPAGETAVISANIYRPYGNYVVYTESNNMARYTTANQYPRAYVGNGRYVGSAELTKICFVCKSSGTEGSYISPGTRITLLGLKV